MGLLSEFATETSSEYVTDFLSESEREILIPLGMGYSSESVTAILTVTDSACRHRETGPKMYQRNCSLRMFRRQNLC
jgi:hypothetical protein